MTKLYERLRIILFECNVHNWDGYGAEPISETVNLRSRVVIRCMECMKVDKYFEVGAASNCVVFEYRHHSNMIFTISITEGDIVIVFISENFKTSDRLPFVDIYKAIKVFKILCDKRVPKEGTNV